MTTEREAYERLKADSYTADYAGFSQRQSDIEVLWQARAAQAQTDDERTAMEAVMATVDPATWPGLTAAQRCALGRFAKPRAALQSAPGQELWSDADINDVTMRVLGGWPSFEAQSWACKVVHAVLREATPPTSATDNREVALLRAVYEAARRFLRNNGVDRERASAAVDELDDAIERVKNFDGGYDEVDTVWDTTTVEAATIAVRPAVSGGHAVYVNDQFITAYFHESDRDNLMNAQRCANRLREALASQPAQPQAEPLTPEQAKANGWWRVEVADHAGQIVCIESAMLSGRDIGNYEAEVIRDCAEHLMSFVGPATTPQAEAQAGETPKRRPCTCHPPTGMCSTTLEAAAKAHFLDQRASSPDECLWLVENRDGSKEIVDAVTKGPRAGMAPPWNLTYREVLKKIVESLESSAQFWMEVFSDYRSGDTKRLTFVSDGIAYTAHVGIHKGRDALGFCGRTIAVKMSDGQEFISNNVWCRGTVPPKLRVLLRDNATMDWDALRNAGKEE